MITTWLLISLSPISFHFMLMLMLLIFLFLVLVNRGPNKGVFLVFSCRGLGGKVLVDQREVEYLRCE
jgi:hypothetical protein